ncbi:KAP family P-loop NTPase fold protein [Sphingomonas radiodurans]|uniref:KAP family P-loop NTPase fold protein n=1 Tax=Sphingomonas radiodurans TaxID=2890321 RepID=UPI001E5C9EA7|nr:P-loop NTPase fold protein [Sphingomonas radiodurans]WBH16889.1 P-loop NTPase fold protein [Sphingomonas radiodurans]
MANNPSDIWKGDRLGRHGEAVMLERFLTSEAAALASLDRKEAYVLALDAPYGEGKSWFLKRFREHLALNHPVAFYDAWVDDGNHEPLVGIMAALEVALKDFLRTKALRTRFSAMTRAALPILGKALLGAGTKAVGKYVGETIFDDAAATVTEKAKGTKKEDDDNSPLVTGLDKLGEGVSEIVDGAGKALLEQYRKRAASREAFKANLLAIAEGFETDDDPRVSPIYIIVDELDRCRPSFAIQLLEEIKHLFDVPGVVFVIALHSGQLTHSIKAIYGEGFESDDYLRRFFSRSYTLRRPSIKELVISHFESIAPWKASMNYPPSLVDGAPKHLSVPEIAGELLSAWDVTPREAIAIMDAFRVFVHTWEDNQTPIELPLLLGLLIKLVRGEELFPELKRTRGTQPKFVLPSSNRDRGWDTAAANELFIMYQVGMNNTLPNRLQHFGDGGVEGYGKGTLMREFAVKHHNSYENSSPPATSWSTYPDRLRIVGRFVASDGLNDGITLNG